MANWYATFQTFLEQDDLLTINTNEYLLLSPSRHWKPTCSKAGGSKIMYRVINQCLKRLTLDQFNNHLLVMFVDQIKAYVIRCINKPGTIV